MSIFLKYKFKLFKFSFLWERDSSSIDFYWLCWFGLVRLGFIFPDFSYINFFYHTEDHKNAFLIPTCKWSENCQQKVNNSKGSLAHLYKLKFVFWQKEKRNIGEFMAKLTVLWFDKKPTSLQSNGMTAIPKNSNKNYQGNGALGN